MRLGDVDGVSYECVLRGLDGIDEDGDVGVDELDDLLVDNSLKQRQ